jgi:hypothetical protein
MADKKFKVNIDLEQNQLVNPVLDNQSTAPGSPVLGQLYYDTGSTRDRTKEYRTGAWHFVGESEISQSAISATTLTLEVATSTYLDTVVLQEATVSNAGLLGASLWSSLDALFPFDPLEYVRWDASDLTTGGPGSSQASWFLNGNNTTWISPSNVKAVSQESIKNYVDQQVAGGVTYKGGFDPTGAAGDGIPDLDTITSVTGDMYTVTIAGTYNFTTGSVVLEVGDVLIAESDGVLNDVADWTIVQKNETGVVSNASGVGTDGHVTMFDTDGNNIEDAGFLASDVFLTTFASETVAGIVEEATQAQMNAGTDVDTTGAPLFVPPSKIIAYVSSATDLARFTEPIGNGVLTVIPVTHSLDNFNVLVQVYEISTGDEIECRISRDTVDTLELEFNTAPTSSQYQVVVIG